MIVKVNSSKFGPMVNKLKSLSAVFNPANKTWSVDDFYAASLSFELTMGYLTEMTSDKVLADAAQKERQERQALTGERETSVKYVNGQRIEGAW